MQRSLQSSSPVVVTLLSPSPAASRLVKKSLMQWTGCYTIGEEEEEEEEPSTSSDALDQAFGKTAVSVLSSSPMQWDSVTLGDPNTTMVHLLAPKHDRGGPLALLAIQKADSLAAARLQLAEALPASHARLALQRLLRLPIAAHHLLGTGTGTGGGLPLVQRWSDEDHHVRPTTTTNRLLTAGQLKEVALPIFDSTVLDTLLAPLERPVVGLYQFPDTQLCLRPLPTGKEDRHLAPPSLIFHVDSLDSVLEQQQQQQQQQQASTRMTMTRIGYSGTQKGQLMLRHPLLGGLDVRLCESKKRTSVFSEAQESLLAGSLTELQSTHVLTPQQGLDDPRINNNMDCWVEFRANLKSNPLGFFRRNGPRIARAPDLPPE
jgi:hypothetical protein